MNAATIFAAAAAIGAAFAATQHASLYLRPQVVLLAPRHLVSAVLLQLLVVVLFLLMLLLPCFYETE